MGFWFEYAMFTSSNSINSDSVYRTDIPGTRELANLNYGLCVKMAPGYCGIEWSQSPGDPYSFTVSGPTDVEMDLLGMQCQHVYFSRALPELIPL